MFFNFFDYFLGKSFFKFCYIYFLVVICRFFLFYNAFSIKPLIFSIYAIIKQFLFSEKFFRSIDRLLEYAIRDEVTITNPSKY